MINRLVTTLIIVILIAGGLLAFGQEARTPMPDPPQKTKPPKAKPEKAPGASSTPEPEENPAQSEPVIVKLPRGGKVAISSRSGNVIVAGWDRDEVQASATAARGAAQIGTQT